MYKYEFSTDGATWKEFTEMYEIEADLKRLTLGNDDIFLVEAIPPIDGVFTIQADGVTLRKGIFKKRDIKVEHAIEVLVGDPEKETEKIYRYSTDNYDELYNIFENYILYQKLPTYELWDDMSDFWGLNSK